MTSSAIRFAEHEADKAWTLDPAQVVAVVLLNHAAVVVTASSIWSTMFGEMLMWRLGGGCSQRFWMNIYNFLFLSRVRWSICLFTTFFFFVYVPVVFTFFVVVFLKEIPRVLIWFHF